MMLNGFSICFPIICRNTYPIAFLVFTEDYLFIVSISLLSDLSTFCPSYKLHFAFLQQLLICKVKETNKQEKKPKNFYVIPLICFQWLDWFQGHILEPLPQSRPQRLHLCVLPGVTQLLTWVADLVLVNFCVWPEEEVCLHYFSCGQSFGTSVFQINRQMLPPIFFLGFLFLKQPGLNFLLSQ